MLTQQDACHEEYNVNLHVHENLECGLLKINLHARIYI
jgi:hypothetical protein